MAKSLISCKISCVRMSSIEYGKEIKLSNKEITKADNTCMKICILLCCGWISASTSCLCREVSLLEMRSTRTHDSAKMLSMCDVVFEWYRSYV